jgi:hypothetical protein
MTTPSTGNPGRAGRTVISATDRLFDAVALLTLASGILLFAAGRSSLGALAAGTYAAPPSGVTWVSRAEQHDAQTRWGVRLAIGGLALALGAVIRHGVVARRD